MSPSLQIPELLAPAGSIDAVRAAVANGANAVYLGVEKFNARDEGAQFTLDELAAAVAIAHARGVRIYLTLNILVKPQEAAEALTLLGECVDRGIDAVIVQDVGLVRLIQRVYPDLEIHGSTQMTVHDAAGAALMHSIGVERVVLARENSLDDIRAIRRAVPDLGLETFVHGALCISYSGQCYMSGMISERSANRGSCAQSCRKDYVLRDAGNGTELDRGYLISAKDLAAHDQLTALAELGIGCLKVEGRKKKPEYVATVTKGYRGFLDRVAAGDDAPPTFEDVRPLVQIYSRGFTAGMFAGRAGRGYITREQPDNRGHEIGVVTGHAGTDLIIDVGYPVAPGDGLGFEPPEGVTAPSSGFTVERVRTLSEDATGRSRQAISARCRVPVGYRVVRSAQGRLSQDARESFAGVGIPTPQRIHVTVRVFGAAGAPLKTIWRTSEDEIESRSDVPLATATAHALDVARLRDQFGRLGDTAFTLGVVDAAGLADGLFLPISALNRVRQVAVEGLRAKRAATIGAQADTRATRILDAVRDVSASMVAETNRLLAAEVFSIGDAECAARGGATEVVFDPFLRHPVPPVARLRELQDSLGARDIVLRLRLPTIVRPADRSRLDKWLALELPVLTGHAGLAVELAGLGRDVVGDYALNCFNPHTAAEYFSRGVRRLVASIELTADEIGGLVTPWGGSGFDVVVYGRPEGMTLEHCVLSAAFGRVATTCRDLCVQKHPVVELTDPAGYTFPVATDSDCRNRLLHSRPVDGSEFAPRLWHSGVRGYRTLFNLPGLPVERVVRAWRDILDALGSADRPPLDGVRAITGSEFTRGHFARAV